MTFAFSKVAEAELFDAVEYYEQQQAGLGIRFFEEIYATIDRICKHPDAWENMDLKTRRCLANKFPYGVLYRIEEDSVWIMAVMNLGRNPDYWKHR